MTMAIIEMPQYKMHWFPEFRYERTATAIILDKFLHVIDNTTKDNPENANEKLSKVRPLLQLHQNRAWALSFHRLTNNSCKDQAQWRCETVQPGENPQMGVQKHGQSWSVWYDLWLFHV